MYKESLEKYNLEYDKVANGDDNKKLIFELSVDFLNLKDSDRPSLFYFSPDFKGIIDRALNSARQHIDELISQNKFIEAERFSKEANDKICKVDVFGVDKINGKRHAIEIGNFFEVYDYRIIDRKYIFNAKEKIEEIEKKSENKIYEVLTIFVTIISIIFAFVNGGSVKIVSFEVPSFVLLAITIIFSWWVIKTINSNK